MSNVNIRGYKCYKNYNKRWQLRIVKCNQLINLIDHKNNNTYVKNKLTEKENQSIEIVMDYYLKVI